MSGIGIFFQLSNISKLRDCLLKNRKAYINASHLMNETAVLSDCDKDKMDADCEFAIKTCRQLLKNMKNSAQLQPNQSDQLRDHLEAIVNILENYLRTVCKIYSEQRAIRVKKAVDVKKMFRLESLVKLKGHKLKEFDIPFDNETERNSVEQNGHVLHTDSKETFPSTSASYHTEIKNNSIIQPGLRERRRPGKSLQTARPNSSRDEHTTQKSLTTTEHDSTSADNESLSPRLAGQLQKENDLIYLQMSTMVDEVKQIEGRVVEIAKLQEVFSEKVLQQEGDINRIQETQIQTTENILYGNDQIREAMKRKAGFRVWILFFLIVMTFTLIFLDWYNP